MKYLIPLSKLTLEQAYSLSEKGYLLDFHYNSLDYNISYVVVSKEA